MAYVSSFFKCDVLVADNPKYVGPFNPLLLGSCISAANSLAYSYQLICIQGDPDVSVLGMETKLPKFKGLT